MTTRRNASGTSAQSSGPVSPNGPWVGTWKKRGTGDTATIFKMWVKGDGFRYTLDITPPACEPTHITAFRRFRRTPSSEKGSPAAENNASTQIDDHTSQLVDLQEGKANIRFTVTFSADGKTGTSTAKRRNAKGEEVTTVGVWDRVE